MSAQEGIISHLRKRGSQRVPTIAAALGMPIPAVSVAVEQLRKSGRVTVMRGYVTIASRPGKLTSAQRDSVRRWNAAAPQDDAEKVAAGLKLPVDAVDGELSRVRRERETRDSELQREVVRQLAYGAASPHELAERLAVPGHVVRRAADVLERQGVLTFAGYRLELAERPDLLAAFAAPLERRDMPPSVLRRVEERLGELVSATIRELCDDLGMSARDMRDSLANLVDQGRATCHHHYYSLPSNAKKARQQQEQDRMGALLAALGVK